LHSNLTSTELKQLEVKINERKTLSTLGVDNTNVFDLSTITKIPKKAQIYFKNKLKYTGITKRISILYNVDKVSLNNTFFDPNRYTYEYNEDTINYLESYNHMTADKPIIHSAYSDVLLINEHIDKRANTAYSIVSDAFSARSRNNYPAVLKLAVKKYMGEEIDLTKYIMRALLLYTWMENQSIMKTKVIFDQIDVTNVEMITVKKMNDLLDLFSPNNWALDRAYLITDDSEKNECNHYTVGRLLTSSAFPCDAPNVYQNLWPQIVDPCLVSHINAIKNGTSECNITHLDVESYIFYLVDKFNQWNSLRYCLQILTTQLWQYNSHSCMDNDQINIYMPPLLVKPTIFFKFYDHSSSIRKIRRLSFGNTPLSLHALKIGAIYSNLLYHFTSTNLCYTPFINDKGALFKKNINKMNGHIMITKLNDFLTVHLNKQLGFDFFIDLNYIFRHRYGNSVKTMKNYLTKQLDVAGCVDLGVSAMNYNTYFSSKNIVIRGDYDPSDYVQLANFKDVHPGMLSQIASRFGIDITAAFIYRNFKTSLQKITNSALRYNSPFTVYSVKSYKLDIQLLSHIPLSTKQRINHHAFINTNATIMWEYRDSKLISGLKFSDLNKSFFNPYALTSNSANAISKFVEQKSDEDKSSDDGSSNESEKDESVTEEEKEENDKEDNQSNDDNLEKDLFDDDQEDEKPIDNKYDVDEQDKDHKFNNTGSNISEEIKNRIVAKEDEDKNNDNKEVNEDKQKQIKNETDQLRSDIIKEYTTLLEHETEDIKKDMHDFLTGLRDAETPLAFYPRSSDIRSGWTVNDLIESTIGNINKHYLQSGKKYGAFKCAEFEIVKILKQFDKGGYNSKPVVPLKMADNLKIQTILEKTTDRKNEILDIFKKIAPLYRVFIIKGRLYSPGDLEDKLDTKTLYDTVIKTINYHVSNTISKCTNRRTTTQLKDRLHEVESIINVVNKYNGKRNTKYDSYFAALNATGSFYKKERDILGHYNTMNGTKHTAETFKKKLGLNRISVTKFNLLKSVRGDWYKHAARDQQMFRFMMSVAPYWNKDIALNLVHAYKKLHKIPNSDNLLINWLTDNNRSTFKELLTTITKKRQNKTKKEMKFIAKKKNKKNKKEEAKEANKHVENKEENKEYNEIKNDKKVIDIKQEPIKKDTHKMDVLKDLVEKNNQKEDENIQKVKIEGI
jgi:hypothetical protein